MEALGASFYYVDTLASSASTTFYLARWPKGLRGLPGLQLFKWI
jgi:hypothetical protein